MKDPEIFKKLTVANGFTLAEVRRYRKVIRAAINKYPNYVNESRENLCEVIPLTALGKVSELDREAALVLDARLGCRGAELELNNLRNNRKMPA